MPEGEGEPDHWLLFLSASVCAKVADWAKKLVVPLPRLPLSKPMPLDVARLMTTCVSQVPMPFDIYKTLLATCGMFKLCLAAMSSHIASSF